MNRNVKYRKTVVYSVILVLAIIFSFLIINVDISESIKEDIGLSYINHREMNSMFNNFVDKNNYFNNKYNEITFYVDREYIENYEYTKEFLDISEYYGVIELEDGSIEVFYNKDEYEYIKNNLSDSIIRSASLDDYEKPILEKDNVTNIEDLTKYNFEDSFEKISKDLENKNILVSHITWGNPDYSVESNKDSFTGFRKDLAEKLVDNQKMYVNYDDKAKVDGYIFYDLSENSNIYNSQKNYEFITELLIKGLIGSLIFSLFVFLYVSILGYRKLEEASTFEWIKKIPMEIIMSLPIFIVFIAAILQNGELDSYLFDGKLVNIFSNKLFVIPLITLFLILTAILVSYIALGIKSIYYDGKNSFIIRNSIIFKIISWIFRKIKKIYIFTFSRLDLSDRKFFIGGFLLLFGLWFLFNAFLTHSFGAFLIGIIPMIALYFVVKKVYVDLKEIKDVTNDYSKGHYDSNVREDNSLKTLSKNINEAGQSLDKAVKKELESEIMKTELITNVSHDLKTPLTSIINYSQLINDPNTKDKDFREYASIIHEKSLRLKTLIDSLFEVSKLNSNNVELNQMDIDLRSILNQALGEWEDKFNEKHLDIVVEMDNKDSIAYLDGQYTYRIFENIFSNIYKYAQDSTRVYVKLANGMINVKNISKYQLNISPKELLERFKRGDESRHTEGSGLGLSIASSLTEVQGGKFDIDIIGDLFMVNIDFSEQMK